MTKRKVESIGAQVWLSPVGEFHIVGNSLIGKMQKLMMALNGFECLGEL